MPVMDGITATKEILENDELQNTNIVALTANSFKEDIEACLACGMTDFVAKPISLAEVRRVLKKALKTKGSKNIAV